MKYLLLILLVSPLFAKMSISDLKSQLDQGKTEKDLMPLVQKEGISFQVNLKNLKKMKKADFPDYLIDGLLELYGPQQNERLVAVNKGTTSSRADMQGSYYVSHFSLGYGLYPLWFSNFGFYPYSYFSGRSYPFWNYYGWSPYFWNYGYGNPYYYGNATPGNTLSPRGFSNNHDGRVNGTAQPRTTPKSKARRFFSGLVKGTSSSSSSPSRAPSSSGSSSRSSSSSSRAVRK